MRDAVPRAHMQNLNKHILRQLREACSALRGPWHERLASLNRETAQAKGIPMPALDISRHEDL